MTSDTKNAVEEAREKVLLAAHEHAVEWEHASNEFHDPRQFFDYHDRDEFTNEVLTSRTASMTRKHVEDALCGHAAIEVALDLLAAVASMRVGE